MESNILIAARLVDFCCGPRLLKMFSADRIILLILSTILGCIWLSKAEAEEMIDMHEYSFTNSPLLIAPQAFQADGRLFVDADARFMNDCYADSGVDASYIDLHADCSGHGQRILILKQKINPEGCPDIYQPALRTVIIASKITAPVKYIILIDHVAKAGGRKLMYPPVSLEVSSGSEVKSDPRVKIQSEALPLAGFDGNLPVLTSARIGSVSVDHLVRYTFKALAPVPKGKRMGESYTVWRFETRVGADKSEESPVTDWLVLLPRRGLNLDSGTVSKALRIEFEGAKGVSRRLGLINPLSGPKVGPEKAPFTFFDVR